MKRRVIFPDPNIWTHKERNYPMTESYADTPNAADGRRAAALITHHRRGDRTGMYEIVNSAVDHGRPTELVLAVMDLYRRAIVELRTDHGLELLAAYVGQLSTATDDPDTIDITRAAIILDAHGRGDFVTLSATLSSASTNKRGSETLLALLDLYAVVLPELTSDIGIGWLDRCATTFFEEEATE